MYRLAKTALYSLFGLLLVFIGFISYSVWQAQDDLSYFLNREADMRTKLELVQKELVQKERYYRLLRNNSVFLEKIVKRKLGYIRPDERVFRFE